MKRLYPYISIFCLLFLKLEALADDLRVQAYMTLQKPYRDCVKAAMSERYEYITQQCMNEGQALAILESCQALAEKRTNEDSKNPDFAKKCMSLKPSKEDFDKYLLELKESKK